MHSLVKWKLKTTSAWSDDLESEDEVDDVEGPLPNKGLAEGFLLHLAATFHNFLCLFFLKDSFRLLLLVMLVKPVITYFSHHFFCFFSKPGWLLRFQIDPRSQDLCSWFVAHGSQALGA